VIGGVSKNSSGAVLAARSVSMTFSLEPDDVSYDWAKEFLRTSREFKSDILQVEFFETVIPMHSDPID
jgi:hypothetical protein